MRIMTKLVESVMSVKNKQNQTTSSYWPKRSKTQMLLTHDDNDNDSDSDSDSSDFPDEKRNNSTLNERRESSSKCHHIDQNNQLSGIVTFNKCRKAQDIRWRRRRRKQKKEMASQEGSSSKLSYFITNQEKSSRLSPKGDASTLSARAVVGVAMKINNNNDHLRAKAASTSTSTLARIVRTSRFKVAKLRDMKDSSDKRGYCKLTSIRKLIFLTVLLLIVPICQKVVFSTGLSHTNNEREPLKTDEKKLLADLLDSTLAVKGSHNMGEHELLLQLLQSTGSVEEANQLLELLIGSSSRRGEFSALDAAERPTADYTQVRVSTTERPLVDQALRGSTVTEAPPVRVYLPAPLENAELSLLDPLREEMLHKNKGLLDELIEASVKVGSSNANQQVHYDDESQQTSIPSALVAQRAIELLRAGKQIENLLSPPTAIPALKPPNFTSSSLASSLSELSRKNITKQSASVNGTAALSSDDEGLSNNESISSLLIRSGNPSRKLIANYSHWIIHEEAPKPTRPIARLKHPDAIRLIKAPSLTTTTTAQLLNTSQERTTTQVMDGLTPTTATTDKPSLVMTQPPGSLLGTPKDEFLPVSSNRLQATRASSKLVNAVVPVHKVVFINSIPQWSSNKTSRVRFKQLTKEQPVERQPTTVMMPVEVNVFAETLKPTTTLYEQKSSQATTVASTFPQNSTQLYIMETFKDNLAPDALTTSSSSRVTPVATTSRRYTTSKNGKNSTRKVRTKQVNKQRRKNTHSNKPKVLLNSSSVSQSHLQSQSQSQSSSAAPEATSISADSFTPTSVIISKVEENLQEKPTKSPELAHLIQKSAIVTNVSTEASVTVPTTTALFETAQSTSTTTTTTTTSAPIIWSLPDEAPPVSKELEVVPVSSVSTETTAATTSSLLTTRSALENGRGTMKVDADVYSSTSPELTGITLSGEQQQQEHERNYYTTSSEKRMVERENEKREKVPLDGESQTPDEDENQTRQGVMMVELNRVRNTNSKEQVVGEVGQEQSSETIHRSTVSNSLLNLPVAEMDTDYSRTQVMLANGIEAASGNSFTASTRPLRLDLQTTTPGQQQKSTASPRASSRPSESTSGSSSTLRSSSSSSSSSTRRPKLSSEQIRRSTHMEVAHLKSKQQSSPPHPVNFVHPQQVSELSSIDQLVKHNDRQSSLNRTFSTLAAHNLYGKRLLEQHNSLAASPVSSKEQEQEHLDIASFNLARARLQTPTLKQHQQEQQHFVVTDIERLMSKGTSAFTSPAPAPATSPDDANGESLALFNNPPVNNNLNSKTIYSTHSSANTTLDNHNSDDDAHLQQQQDKLVYDLIRPAHLRLLEKPVQVLRLLHHAHRLPSTTSTTATPASVIIPTPTTTYSVVGSNLEQQLTNSIGSSWLSNPHDDQTTLHPPTSKPDPLVPNTSPYMLNVVVTPTSTTLPPSEPAELFQENLSAIFQYKLANRTSSSTTERPANKIRLVLEPGRLQSSLTKETKVLRDSLAREDRNKVVLDDATSSTRTPVLKLMANKFEHNGHQQHFEDPENNLSKIRDFSTVVDRLTTRSDSNGRRSSISSSSSSSEEEKSGLNSMSTSFSSPPHHFQLLSKMNNTNRWLARRDKHKKPTTSLLHPSVNNNTDDRYNSPLEHKILLFAGTNNEQLHNSSNTPKNNNNSYSNNVPSDAYRLEATSGYHNARVSSEKSDEEKERKRSVANSIVRELTVNNGNGNGNGIGSGVNVYGRGNKQATSMKEERGDRAGSLSQKGSHLNDQSIGSWATTAAPTTSTSTDNQLSLAADTKARDGRPFGSPSASSPLPSTNSRISSYQPNLDSNRSSNGSKTFDDSLSSSKSIYVKQVASSSTPPPRDGEYAVVNSDSSNKRAIASLLSSVDDTSYNWQQRKRRREPPGVPPPIEQQSVVLSSSGKPDVNIFAKKSPVNLGNLFKRLPSSLLADTVIENQFAIDLQSELAKDQRFVASTGEDRKKGGKFEEPSNERIGVNESLSSSHPVSEAATNEPSDMLVNASQHQRTSLSPLVDEYRVNSLLKTMINLGVPGGSASSTSGQGVRGLPRRRSEQQQQVRLVRLGKISPERSSLLNAVQQQATTQASLEFPSMNPSRVAELFQPESNLNSNSDASVTRASLPSTELPLSARSRWRLLGEQAQQTPLFFEKPPKSIATKILPSSSSTFEQTLNPGAASQTQTEPSNSSSSSNISNNNSSNSLKLSVVQAAIGKNFPSTSDRESNSSYEPSSSGTSNYGQFPSVMRGDSELSSGVAEGSSMIRGKSNVPVELVQEAAAAGKHSRQASVTLGGAFGSEVDSARTVNSREKSVASSYLDSFLTSDVERNSSSEDLQVLVTASSSTTTTNVPAISTKVIYDDTEQSANAASVVELPAAGVVGTGENLLNQATQYRPPLSLPTSDAEDSSLRSRPFGLRPSVNRDLQLAKSQQHRNATTFLAEGPSIRGRSRLSSVQRVAVLTISACCGLLVIVLLVVAITIKCRTSLTNRRSSTSRAVGGATAAAATSTRRRRSKHQRAGAGSRKSSSVERVSQLSETKISKRASSSKKRSGNSKRMSKNLSKSKLLLEAEFTNVADRAASSGAESSSSLCLSTSSENFLNMDDKRRVLTTDPSTSKMFKSRQRQRSSKVAQKQKLQQEQQQYATSAKSSMPTSASHNQLRGEESRGTLRERISGTLTSRLLRLHLPRLLPYFALDYSSNEQQLAPPANVHGSQQQQQRQPLSELQNKSNNKQQQLTIGDLLSMTSSSTTTPKSEILSPPTGQKVTVPIGSHQQQHQQQQQQNFHLKASASEKYLERKLKSPAAITSSNGARTGDGARVLKPKKGNKLCACHCSNCSGSAGRSEATGQQAACSLNTPCLNKQQLHHQSYNSKVRLPFGAASSVLRHELSSSHLAGSGSNNPGGYHRQQQHQANNKPFAVPIKQAMNSRHHPMSGSRECAQDNVSMQQSQVDNEHHLLIDNELANSNASHYQLARPTELMGNIFDNHQARNQYHPHRKPPVHDENEENELTQNDNNAHSSSGKMRRVLPKAHLSQNGIIATRFSQLSDSLNTNMNFDHHHHHQQQHHHLHNHAYDENEENDNNGNDIEKDDDDGDEDDDDDESESDTHNYHNLNYPVYAPHHTYLIQDKDADRPRKQQRAINGSANTTSNTNNQPYDTSNVQSHSHYPHHGQQDKQHQQHPNLNCNCNLVLFPL